MDVITFEPVKIVEEYVEESTAIINGELVQSKRTYSSRVVFFLDDIVVKVDPPGWKDGDNDYAYQGDLPQSEVEIDFWYNIVEEEDKKFFVPIIAYGKGWVAQKRIQNPIPPNEEVFWEFLWPIIKKYGLHEDVERERNWFMDECGNPLIFDYGMSDTED